MKEVSVVLAICTIDKDKLPNEFDGIYAKLSQRVFGYVENLTKVSKWRRLIKRVRMHHQGVHIGIGGRYGSSLG